VTVRSDCDAIPFADKRQDRARADIGLPGTGWFLDRQYGSNHVIHGNGARNGIFPVHEKSGKYTRWPGPLNPGMAALNIVDDSG